MRPESTNGAITPFPFLCHRGTRVIVAQSDTRYACPLTGCEKELKKRDDMQKHVVTEHNGGVSIKVFDTRDAPMDEDHDVSPRVLVPATPSPQRIMPIVDDGSPVDSATVKLLPSVDYLKSTRLSMRWGAIDLWDDRARPRLKDRLKEMFLPGLEAALVVPADTERERTPLVRCMAWDTFMPETRMNPTQRRAAQEIKKQHTDQEHDGILSLLAETVDDHFHKAATILDGHPQKLSLSKILVHGENIPREMRGYSLEADRRVEQELSPLYHPIQQTHLLDKLIMMLRNPDASRRSRMISYHNLAWSLVDADPMQCNASWGNPIQRAIWLKALRADGNFYEPRDFTPDLAKWKYLCNITALLEALLDKDSDTDSLHPDDFERIARVHEKVLSLGRPTTFNMIYEMQQYASSLAFNQTQEAKVFVDPDFKWITIGLGDYAPGQAARGHPGPNAGHDIALQSSYAK
ncbi:hypothetical protein DFH29DRAFT_1008531 [Suillus ampliporus]|nr:hypothetical protein DFH29DRAFT_1008531 [Suillus ampliporus]